MNELYSKFRKGFIAAATIGFMAISAPAQAVPVVVEFSFGVTNDQITGTILGLDDSVIGDQAATSVLATGGLLGLNTISFIETLVTIPTVNSFTFSSGVLSTFNFLATTPDLFSLRLYDLGFVLVGDAGGGGNNIATIIDLNISPVVSAVPLPPAGVLFGSGLVVLAAMRRRAKKQATA